MPPDLNVTVRGQVFTPAPVVERMLALIRHAGRWLEPSCGDGAFSHTLRRRSTPSTPSAQGVAIEHDPRIAPADALCQDFFAYPASETFDTIIGNPPYVRSREILPDTRKLLASQLLDGHANLYLHFIEKCVRHLRPGGELIFITPRNFLKATGAARLNTWLFDQGTITDIEELGDARIFEGVVPNCVIWRFEKGNLSRRTTDGRRMSLSGGQILFTRGIYSLPLKQVFAVRVGAVSGADDVFADPVHGDTDFVCSRTERTGEVRRMIYPAPDAPPPDILLPHKARLLARRVKPFDETNWWHWGRRGPVSSAPRIYVNHKTRSARPFFLHPCPQYDGAVLGLFPHRPEADLATLVDQLNAVDWGELGFVCDGRHIFTQRSLEQAPLPEDFAPFAARGLV